MKLSAYVNNWEFGANISIWILAVFYGIFKFYKASLRILSHNSNYTNDEITDGWPILKLKQDISDIEWSIFLEFHTYSILPVISYLVLFYFIKSLGFHAKIQVFQILASLVYLSFRFSILTILIILIQPITFFIFGKTRKKYSIWFCSLINLFGITLFKDIDSTIINISDSEHYITILAIFWINLRCTSYYLDVVAKEYNSNLIDMFAYALYLPVLFTGPFISYTNYNNCLIDNELPIQTKLNKLFIKLVRYSFWAVFIQFSLHYIYVNAMYYQYDMINSFDSWTLYGYGYCMGQFFHMKYVVLYGFSTAIAEFDGVEIPPLPKCIGRIHLYSDMWKYFDRGLYTFLVRYIYKPMLYNKTICNKLFASLMTFAFVYLWHGVQHYILIWSLMNYIGVILEMFFSYFYINYLGNRINISLVWERRLASIFAAPLLAMTAVSNFYFFAGLDIGNLFLSNLFFGDLLTKLLLFIILYCCCQVSAEIKLIEKVKKLTH